MQTKVASGSSKVKLNNIAGSVNHKVKSYIGWKHMHLHTLVQNIHEIVQIQFIDIKKIFAGKSTFFLRMEDPPVANSENLDQFYTDFLKGDLPCDSKWI